MKNSEEGITLIALIITIIIMLILVTLTINVSLKGGLFTNTQNASEEMQKEIDIEELTSLSYEILNNASDLKITKKILEDNLSYGWKIKENTIIDENNETWYSCTSPKGYKYYLNTTTGEAIAEDDYDYDSERQLGYLERRINPSPNVVFNKEYISTDYISPAGTENATGKLVITKDELLIYENDNLIETFGQQLCEQVDGYVANGALTQEQVDKWFKTGNNMIGYVNIGGNDATLIVFTNKGEAKLYYKHASPILSVVDDLTDIIDENNLFGTFYINN